MTHPALLQALEVLERSMEAGMTGIKVDQAITALRQALEQPQTPDDLLRQSEREGWRYARECEAEVKRLRQALEHVPDTTKMTEPEELVCVCGAIWQGQEMICPPRCLEEGIEREMPIDRGAWDDVPDVTKWVDELRGGDETEEQEPVAYLYKYRDGWTTQLRFDGSKPLETEKLYTAPPSKPWVGLTDDEVNDLKHWLDHRAQWSYIEFARAIGAKLKEKNRG